MLQEPSRHPNSQAGFTLVEALVSMTLLSIGLVPVFWQSTQALALSQRIKHTMIASNLAQEGVELTRAIRDTNWLTQQPTWQGMSGCGTSAGGCEVELNQTDKIALAQLNGSPAHPLRFVPGPGLYQYAEGAESPFTRVIMIDSGATADERVITSKVSWRERSEMREVVLEYHLYDWLQ